MKKLAWFSDIHLNFLGTAEIRKFTGRIRGQNLDAILICGDISEAPTVGQHLKLLERELQLSVYFVLGNHDFYFGSIAGVSREIAALCQKAKNLCWLTTAGIVELTSATALVGHDGWADGRFGNFYLTPQLLNDYQVIQELANLDDASRFRQLNYLGDAAANHFKEILPNACQSYPKILLITHVPPFREACWHLGQISDAESLPHFSCKAVGEVLVDIMQAQPHCELTVLCGHTHSSGFARILPNLVVYTGRADYGKPEIQRILEIE